MTVLIFANGVIDELGWIRPYLESATLTIAANGGSRHLFHLQHPPDLVIGDTDSIPAEINRWLEANKCDFIRSPAEKDETDLELALIYAVTHYQEEVLLFGTLGGRLDQTLGNILLLTHPGLTNHNVRLLSQHETAWIIQNETHIQGQVGDILSLIPLNHDVWVKNTRGLKYSLSDEPLHFGPARGVSNVLIEPEAVVSIHSGLLLCIHNHASNPDAQNSSG